MATLEEYVIEFCNGETPEAILIGDQTFASLEAAGPFFQIEMDPCDRWAVDLPHLRIWTPSYVIFSDEYDTRGKLVRVERHPFPGPAGPAEWT